MSLFTDVNKFVCSNPYVTNECIIYTVHCHSQKLSRDRCPSWTCQSLHPRPCPDFMTVKTTSYHGDYIWNDIYRRILNLLKHNLASYLWQIFASTINMYYYPAGNSVSKSVILPGTMHCTSKSTPYIQKQILNSTICIPEIWICLTEVNYYIS